MLSSTAVAPLCSPFLHPVQAQQLEADISQEREAKAELAARLRASEEAKAHAAQQAQQLEAELQVRGAG
jgi:hypothetical protein